MKRGFGIIIYYQYVAYFMVVMTMSLPQLCDADTLDAVKAERNGIIDDFRVNGSMDLAKTEVLEARLKNLEQVSEGKQLGQIVLEQATVQRIRGQFYNAIRTYERAARLAEDTQDTGTAFDAWLGMARSHANGTRNHGAADAAFERAVVSAGDRPTPKQRYEMADYLSQLQNGRGELESALLNALKAIKLSQNDSDRFYAYFDTGDVLQSFAGSCDYRKLVDAKTYSEDDPWGACKRAVGSARSYYEKARDTAKVLGWTALEKQMQGFIDRLDLRLALIIQKANFEQIGQKTFFNAVDLTDVVVNEDFASGGSELTDLPVAELIDQVAPESRTDDPRTLYLRGIKADVERKPALALEHFQKAAKLLGVERASLVDLRQSGTVIENRTELIRDLGLRLLKLGKFDDAFVVFESFRSHGLEWLTTAFTKNHFSGAERKWLASMIQIDSLTSAKQNGLVETAIAGVEHSRSLELLDELDRLKQQRRDRAGEKQFQSLMERLKGLECDIPTMTQLQESVLKTQVPVLLYWVTPANVVVWVVSPGGVTVKTVFLPEAAVVDKVSEMSRSLRSAGQPFNDKVAKQLHTYLVKPFAKYLTQRQVVIVPQGPLVGLPFEALIDAEDGKFLAEKVSVSYAPNAASVMRMFRKKLPSRLKITALYDEKLENETHEIARIAGVKGVALTSHSSKVMNAENALKLMEGGNVVHVLMHGEFNIDDPLQSSIKIREGDNRFGGLITASELVAANWRDTDLAVFSSCEGAVVKTRISNEQLGISWALLAGGVGQVMLSRWRVNAASNALWMEAFYRSLIVEKTSPALAANAAMRKMIKTGKRHPYYWAGPQVFGK